MKNDVCSIRRVPITKYGCEILFDKVNADIRRARECQDMLFPIINACSIKIHGKIKDHVDNF